MKILFVVTYYHPYWTGLTQYARKIAERFASDEHAVCVITTQHDQSLPLTEQINGVIVVRKPVLFRLSRTLISLSLLVALPGEIGRSERVIIFLPCAEVFFIALVCRLLGKPFFLVHNGDLVLPKNGGIVNRCLEWLYYWCTSMAIRLSCVTIIHTRDYADHSALLHPLEKKTVVIVPPFETTPPDARYAKKLQKEIIPANVSVIGFAGRFVEEKGFDVLLRAIPFIIAKMPNVRFVYAGETAMSYESFYEQQRSLVEQYKEHVIILGRIDSAQMTSFYEACDVFVISSRTDCFPFVQVEALRCGVPVVVSDIPGARWAVQKSGMGEVVPAENPHALAEGILHVLSHRSRYVRQKQIDLLFDADASFRAYERVITGGCR